MTKRIKAIGRWILWPPAAVLIPLLPIAGVLLVCAFALPAVSEPVRLSAYTLSAYALLVLCLRLPRVIRRGRAAARRSPRIARWQDDAALRFQVALYGSLVWNAAYAALQLGLGVVHASSWYYALAVYYLLLALMRFWLLRSARTGRPGERLRPELLRYELCGWGLLLMALVLCGMMVLMISGGRSFRHHQITAIAMAAYTFTALIGAIVSLVRSRRMKSPVVSAATAVRLAAACVSMLTLEATMLTTFGNEDAEFRRMMLAGSGGAVFLFLILLSLFMIVSAHRRRVGLPVEKTLEGPAS